MLCAEDLNRNYCYAVLELKLDGDTRFHDAVERN